MSGVGLETYPIIAEMFRTLISSVGINSSNSTKTMMNSEDAMTNETAYKTPMAMMQH